MRKLLVIFEDHRHPQFFPAALTRPVYLLRSGMTELWIPIKRAFPGYDIAFESAHLFAPLVARHTGAPVNKFEFSRYDRITLFNGAVAPDKDFVGLVESCDFDTAFVRDNMVGAIVLAGASESSREYEQIEHELDKYVSFARALPNSHEASFRSYNYIWDLMTANPDNIGRDFDATLGTASASARAKLDSGVLVGGRAEDIFAHSEATIMSGAGLDSSSGPIYLDADSVIEPFALVKGPFYLGPGSRLAPGVFAGSTVGPMCRVGGELEETVLSAYVNKHHAGFIGHSYVGEWVNFGAMTTNSDLKNNYSSVRVTLGGETIDTREMKIGSFIGDHAKFGIGTLLTTGVTVGVCCNIFGGGLVSDKEVKSFSWGKTGAWERHDFDKAIATARLAMGRRSRELSEDEVTNLRWVWDMVL